MAVNVYKNKLKSALRNLEPGQSVRFSSDEIPYRYFRSNIHIVAAEIDIQVRIHAPKPFDVIEVKRVA